MNETILRKYNLINKSCLSMKDVADLLDISKHQAKLIVTEIRKENTNNPYIRKGHIPFGVAEQTLTNYGLDQKRIIKAYEREIKNEIKSNK